MILSQYQLNKKSQGVNKKEETTSQSTNNFPSASTKTMKWINRERADEMNDGYREQGANLYNNILIQERRHTNFNWSGLSRLLHDKQKCHRARQIEQIHCNQTFKLINQT